MERVQNVAAVESVGSGEPAVKSLAHVPEEKLNGAAVLTNAQPSTPLGTLGKLPLEIRREVYRYLTGTFHYDMMSFPEYGHASSETDANELSRVIRLSRALREELNDFWRIQGSLTIYIYEWSSSSPLGIKGSLLETVSNAPNLQLIFSIKSLEKMALEKAPWPQRLLGASTYGSTLSHDLGALLQPLKNQRRCQLILFFYTMERQSWSRDSYGLWPFVCICQMLRDYQRVAVHLRYCGISGLIEQVKPRFVQFLMKAYGTASDNEDIGAFAERMFEQASGRAKIIRETLAVELEESLGPVVAEVQQTLGWDLEIVLSFCPAQHSAGKTTS